MKKNEGKIVRKSKRINEIRVEGESLGLIPETS